MDQRAGSRSVHLSGQSASLRSNFDTGVTEDSQHSALAHAEPFSGFERADRTRLIVLNYLQT
jgi:hypothetical protein